MEVNEILGERIGEGLVRIGKISAEQVETVLAEQKGGDNRLFGEIAHDLGYIDLMDVIEYLEGAS